MTFFTQMQIFKKKMHSKTNDTIVVLSYENYELEKQYDQITKTIDYYFTLFAIPVGIIGNVFTFLIFSRRALNQNTSMGFFNRFLSMSNIITLCFIMFFMQSDLLFRFNFYTYSDSTCKFIIYTRRLIREASPTLEMLVCVDRFLVVIFPAKFALMRKNVNIFFVIIAILLVYSFLNIGNLFFEVRSEQFSILLSNKSVLNITEKSCHAQTTELELLSDIILIMLRSFLPLTVMFTLNAIIITKLHTNNKFKTSKNGESSKSKKDFQFTKSVLQMNFVFMIFNIPTAIVYIIKDAYIYSSFTSDREIVHMKTLFLNLVWSISFDFASFYYVIFVFLNYHFNKLFRKEVKLILGYLSSVLIGTNSRISEGSTLDESSLRTKLSNNNNKNKIDPNHRTTALNNNTSVVE
jgi:hypothetical protein